MKLKYLLPVATIASVAATVTPFGASCSQKKYDFIVDQVQTAQDKFSGLSSEPKDIDINKKYSFKVDFSRWVFDDGNQPNILSIGSDTNFPEINSADFTISVNGNKWSEGNDYKIEYIKFGESNSGSSYMVRLLNHSFIFDNSTIMTGTFSLAEALKDGIVTLTFHV